MSDASVLSRKRAYHQRGWAGCAARRVSAGLAVANSNERNEAARPPSLARREPSQGANAAQGEWRSQRKHPGVLRPLPRTCHWLQGAPCLGSLGRL